MWGVNRSNAIENPAHIARFWYKAHSFRRLLLTLLKAKLSQLYILVTKMELIISSSVLCEVRKCKISNKFLSKIQTHA